jgi:rod shape-determining protein MreC
LSQFFRNKPFLITLIVIAALIGLIILTSGDGGASLPENAGATVLSPVQNALHSVADWIAGAFRSIFTPGQAEAEMTELRNKAAMLEAENQTLRELKAENERLKDMLNFSEEHPEYELASGRVIARSSDHWFDVFTIDIGTTSGVEKDMPVIYGNGLVGRVTEAGANWSKVISVIDGRSSVHVIVERTRDNGTAQGEAQPNELNAHLDMLFLPYEADVVPGDRIITSGLGGVFPKGILVGEVIEAERTQADGLRNVTVKPTVDFRHIEEVSVILNALTPISTGE